MAIHHMKKQLSRVRRCSVLFLHESGQGWVIFNFASLDKILTLCFDNFRILDQSWKSWRRIIKSVEVGWH